jgi:hypothetical protein
MFKHIVLSSMVRLAKGSSDVDIQREIKSAYRSNDFYHEFVPCPIKFELNDCYEETENSNDVFQTTDRDNEPSMSIEDQRFHRRPRIDLPAPACAFLITREGRKH